MGSTWLREVDREQIWDLRSQGLNTNEIALTMGRAYSSVATVIKATGRYQAGTIPTFDPSPIPGRAGGDFERNLDERDL